jgi:hypothetical protein
MSDSRRHSPAFVAGNDAPHVGERAATRGRIATKVGDERAGVKTRHPFELAFANRIAGAVLEWRLV